MFLYNRFFRASKRRSRVKQKKALLIGLNYKGTGDELNGCENDVDDMANLLKSKFGYNYQDIKVLKDKDLTANSFLSLMTDFFAGAQPGDEYYFHFSGHGTQVCDYSGDEDDGLDEAVYVNGNAVSDDRINNILRSIPAGVRVTAVFDCCNSGTIADLRFRYLGGHLAKVESNRKAAANIIVISGCKDEQTSADAYIYEKGDYYGALTSSLIDLCEHEPVEEYGWLVFIGRLQEKLSGDYSQVPQLSSNFISDFNGFVKF